MGRAAAWFFAASLGLSSIPASAAGPSGSGPVTEERAVELFEAGRYEEAIDIFQTLYDRGGSPNFLYNIARIYEDDGKLAEALDYYERFVHARGAGLEERKLASERAAALRQILESSGEKQADEPAPTTPEPEPQPQPRTETQPLDDTPPDDERTTSRLAIAGYTVLGLGAVTVGAGGIVAALALSDDRSLTSGPVRDDAPDLQEKGARKALTADILFGVGGVLVVSGIAMVVADVVKKRRNTTASKRRWHVGPGPTVVGLGFQARI